MSFKDELYVWLKDNEKSTERGLGYNDGYYVENDYYHGQLHLIEQILDNFYKHYISSVQEEANEDAD